MRFASEKCLLPAAGGLSVLGYTDELLGLHKRKNVVQILGEAADLSVPLR